MKDKLLVTLQKIKKLLKDCGWNEKAGWFGERIERINSLDVNSSEFVEVLRDIKNIIAGMGSLTDLPLLPGKGTKLTEQQARAMQWDLAAELGNIIDGMLNLKK